jgi:hypothetical protein
MAHQKSGKLSTPWGGHVGLGLYKKYFNGICFSDAHFYFSTQSWSAEVEATQAPFVFRFLPLFSLIVLGFSLCLLDCIHFNSVPLKWGKSLFHIRKMHCSHTNVGVWKLKCIKMKNTFIYWLEKHLSMKINHCINSNFGRTKRERERDGQN